MDYLADLFEFLKIDTTSAKGKGEEGAKYLVDYMESNGINARLIRDKSKNPYVYGEIDVGAKTTLLIYNHYDVQPVEPIDKWNSDPFNPIEKDGKIYARGVGDDKGTLMARLQKIISLYKEQKLKINIKFIYEGEEEIGSPNIVSFLTKYRDLLKSDYILWEGSGRDSEGYPEIVLGVKGLLYVELRASTEKDLHSMYAPIVQNPVWKLVYFLNNLRDHNGKVKIKGFYDDVKWLTEEEVKYLKANKKEMEKALGQKINDDNFMRKLIEEPTCNIAGIFGGYTGEGSKTVIPSYSFVKIDFRLVPNQDPDKILSELQNMASSEGIQVIVYGKVKPYRTSISSKISKALIESAKETYNVDPVILPNSPGTGPMESFASILNNNQIADGIGVDNASSNIHSFNENIFKDDYFKAMAWLQSFLEKIS
ncbi:M20/M25/M40 family metallo-hydrolase [Acidianus sulfidivorans JP7]|uniref:Acetylornithine deacetylase n=1 Tax=Acidianus sulfidivorans JP7 TaxID=619593 RepID=A0A2U9IMY5_9CREN|nr:M20/M25/M40 family metallo-hydrolase [Acidianus sulfidivorans]AWR97393.1 M20/M25/M40 family metallo-hydrolase [Acidianus sulfidivorans JP7]